MTADGLVGEKTVKTGGRIHDITEKNYKRALLCEKPTNSGMPKTE